MPSFNPLSNVYIILYYFILFFLAISTKSTQVFTTNHCSGFRSVCVVISAGVGISVYLGIYARLPLYLSVSVSVYAFLVLPFCPFSLFSLFLRFFSCKNAGDFKNAPRSKFWACPFRSGFPTNPPFHTGQQSDR